VKRRDLIKKLEETGCVWYQNPRTKISQPISRHREIKDSLAKHIIKMLKDDV